MRKHTKILAHEGKRTVEAKYAVCYNESITDLREKGKRAFYESIFNFGRRYRF